MRHEDITHKVITAVMNVQTALGPMCRTCGMGSNDSSTGIQQPLENSLPPVPRVPVVES
jgi:Fe-S cluster biogenesis protein NfuA